MGESFAALLSSRAPHHDCECFVTAFGRFALTSLALVPLYCLIPLLHCPQLQAEKGVTMYQRPLRYLILRSSYNNMYICM